MSSHVLLTFLQLFVLRFVETSLGVFILLLVINGLLINGPYGMITTAVSSDLVGYATDSVPQPCSSNAPLSEMVEMVASLELIIGYMATTIFHWGRELAHCGTHRATWGGGGGGGRTK